MSNEELVRLYQSGNKQALEELVEKNEGIVYKLANKFFVEGSNSIDREDLIQEGYIGLMTAANKYDLNNEKRAKFITYAVHWIYNKISRFIKCKNTYEESSLNKPISVDGDTELQDSLEYQEIGFENIENKLYLSKLRCELESVMKENNSLIERNVLKLYYGWDSKECTFDGISTLLGITSREVSNIERRALTKIRCTKWARMKALGIKREEIIYSSGYVKVQRKIDFSILIKSNTEKVLR